MLCVRLRASSDDLVARRRSGVRRARDGITRLSVGRLASGVHSHLVAVVCDAALVLPSGRGSNVGMLAIFTDPDFHQDDNVWCWCWCWIDTESSSA